MEESIETPAVEPEVPAETPANPETPESDPILESLSDDQSDVSDKKPEESEEDKKEKTDNPADKEPTTDDDKKESETEAKPEAEQKEEELSPEEAKKEEARRRYEEREKVRAERRNRVAEQTQPYVEEAIDDADQRLRAMEISEYNRTIEGTENALISEFDRAKANPELQIFNPDSDQFSPKLYEKAMKDYNAGYINYDANGNMVGLKGSLYQHLTETAELYQGERKAGAFQQVRDQRKMKTKADSKPAETPKEDAPKDPILEILSSD